LRAVAQLHCGQAGSASSVATKSAETEYLKACLAPLFMLLLQDGKKEAPKSKDPPQPAKPAWNKVRRLCCNPRRWQAVESIIVRPVLFWHMLCAG
jgi:hypothetical protein